MALRVTVDDQAALHGLLHKIRDLGLPLISVVPAERADTTHAQLSILTSLGLSPGNGLSLIV